MKRANLKRLGDRELDIMQALWGLKSATVADVHQALNQQGEAVAYTTVQTMLNRLEKKGYVARDNKDRAHSYYPVYQRPKAVKGAVKELANRFFQGSVEALAAHLVESNLTSKQLDRIKSIIDEHEQKGKSK